jgi:hypothetical protein
VVILEERMVGQMTRRKPRTDEDLLAAGIEALRHFHRTLLVDDRSAQLGACLALTEAQYRLPELIETAATMPPGTSPQHVPRSGGSA